MSESIFNLISQHDYANSSSLAHSNPSKPRPDHAPSYKLHGQANKQGAKTISGMTAYELAMGSKFSEAEEYHRAPKNITKPAVPVFKKQSDLDPSEVARRRQQAQMRGGAIANIFGTTSGSKGLQRHVSDNKMSVKEQSIINGLLKEQESNPMTSQVKKDNRGGKAPMYPGQRNFVEDNKNSVAEHAARKVASMTLKENAPSKMADSFKNRPAGQIPKYLIERKIEMQVEKAMADEEERKRNGELEIMPEAERLATLEELNRQKNAALQELNSIPPSKAALEGYKAQAKKIEERLKEIDKAVTLFSKKVVYIQ